MAFPYNFQSNFEGGVLTEWDSTTGSFISAPHYSKLAGIPGMPAPYKGAFCMMVDLRGGTTADQTVTEADIAIADAATRYFRFAIYPGPNFTATADDVFNIFELQQTGGTVEMSLGMRVTAATNLLEIGVGDGTAPSSYVGIQRGRWTIVELEATVSTGGSGTMTLYLDGAQKIALTTLTQAAAVGKGVFGTQDTLATTTGILLFDDFLMDDARLYPPNERFPSTVRVTKTRHIFVGPGWIESATILATNAQMTIYDSDSAGSLDGQSAVITLDTGGNKFVSNDSPTYFERGCYVVLAGTNPFGEVKLVRSGGDRGVFGPVCNNDANIRNHGFKRKPRILNV